MAVLLKRIIGNQCYNINRYSLIHFQPFYRFTMQNNSTFDECKLMQSIDSISAECEKLENAENVIRTAFFKDQRWESIMNEIRCMDPYTSSIDLNRKCAKFIAEYLWQGRPPSDIRNHNNIKQGHPDADICYLLHQNIIERSHDTQKIKQALWDKIEFTMKIQDNGNNFKDTVDRFLTDFGLETDNSILLGLYNVAIILGSWQSLPMFQPVLRDNPNFMKWCESWDSTARDSWWQLRNVHHVCEEYDFNLPDYKPTNFIDDMKVTKIKQRLNVDSIRCESEEFRDKYMKHWMVDNNELYTDWIILEFGTKNGDEHKGDPNVVSRDGTTCFVQIGDGKTVHVLIGPCLNYEVLHCKQMACIDMNEETGMGLWGTETLMIDKKENGNYEGYRYAWIDRFCETGNIGKTAGRVLEFSIEFVMELE